MDAENSHLGFSQRVVRILQFHGNSLVFNLSLSSVSVNAKSGPFWQTVRVWLDQVQYVKVRHLQTLKNIVSVIV